jgi:thioredoxin 1
MTIAVNNSNFEAEVVQSDIPVVVDFWAEWCGPCKRIGPALEELSVEFAGRVKVAKLNVDENPELAARFGVRSIPMLALFREGAVADIRVGAAAKKDYSDWMSANA